MQSKILKLARSRQQERKRSSILLFGAAFVSGFLLLLIMTGSGGNKKASPLNVMRSEPDIERSLNSQQFAFEVADSFPPSIVLDIDYELLDRYEDHVAFSPVIKDLRADLQFRGQAGEPRGRSYLENLQTRFDVVKSDIAKYESETTEKLDQFIVQGNDEAFRRLWLGSEGFIDADSSSKYPLFRRVSDSDYFEQHDSMLRYRREGNLEGELNAIIALEIIVNNNFLADRVTELEIEIKRNAVSALELEIISSIEVKAFRKAGQLVGDLRNLDSSNSNLPNYESTINLGIREQEKARLLADGAELLKSEDFNQAAANFKSALELDPSEETALLALSQIEEIEALARDLSGLNADPSRLSDNNVALFAERVLDAAARYSSISVISAESEILKQNLSRSQTSISVEIISDGKARIEVRGVGYIEPTLGKVITLKPGTYTFNAVCRGYRNNLKIVEVSELQPPLEIKCGEKL